MSWIGTGRFIFSHDLNDSDFAEIANRFVAAAQAMHADGWWWQRRGVDEQSHQAPRSERAVQCESWTCSIGSIHWPRRSQIGAM